VPLSLWGCREHWYVLPRELRVNIVLTYARGIDDDTHPTPNYIEACRQAREWIAQHHPEASPAHNRENEATGADNARRDLP
jgi:hypothetical protein